MATQLNQAQYQVAKAILGIPGAATGGTHLSLLSETRILTRASAMLVQRIAMTIARVAFLPPEHPTAIAARAIHTAGTQGTWWQYARQTIKQAIRIEESIEQFHSISDVAGMAEQEKRKVLRACKIKVVRPAVRSTEEDWFRQQLAALVSEASVPYSAIAPPRQYWKASERWACWPHSQ